MNTRWSGRLVIWGSVLPASLVLVPAIALAEIVSSSSPVEPFPSLDVSDTIPASPVLNPLPTPAPELSVTGSDAESASMEFSDSNAAPAAESSPPADSVLSPEAETPAATTDAASPPAEEPAAETTAAPEELPLDTGDEDSAAAEVLTPEEEAQRDAENARLQLLIEGDRLFLEGRIAEAEALYRQAKPPMDPMGILAVRDEAAALPETDTPDESASAPLEGEVLEVGIHTAPMVERGDRPEPHENADALPPAASVYWREALAGRESQSIPRMLVALKLLTEEYPEFIPGHILYAQVLREQEQPEDAAEVLERATSLYPNHAGLATARIQSLETSEEWLQASLAARQFATFNPDHADSPAMIERAEENLERFRRQIRNRIRSNTIANAITGAISYAATGTLLGPLTALDSALLLMRGESSVGESVANSAIAQLEIVDDPEVVAYVDSIGQKLAALAGRDEFEYEFYVVNDDSLNAFALPGGKIFVNTGAIMATRSEAELAGLLAHELAHAVLSHGFQMVTTANMTSSILQTVPNGDLFTALTVLDYSRDMERQADDLGTRILASAGYAADGLYNLMVTLDEENGRGGWSWLSSHPATIERVRNIATQIQENGYNRYAYEGVEPHQQIQARLEELAQAAEAAEAEENEGASETDIPESSEQSEVETEPRPVPEASSESGVLQEEHESRN